MDPIRRTLLSATASACTLLLHGAAMADNYPTKPITLVVPFVAGGSADIIARVVAQSMSTTLRQAVVIDNRSGAGGLVGATYVANAHADGYTLLLTTDSMYAINPSLYGKKAQDVVAALAPVGHLAEAPLVVAVPGDSPVHDFPSLLAHAKSAPKGLTYGTPGVGTDHHLLGELIAKTGDVKLSHVPYRGAAAALADLAGKQIDMLITLVTTAQPMLASGKVKLVAVATTQAYAAQPQLSRMGQTLKGVDMLVSYGITAPAATPQAVMDRLNKAVNAALTDKAVNDKLIEQGLTPTGGTIAAFAQRMKDEQRQREAVIRDANVKLSEQ